MVVFCGFKPFFLYVGYSITMRTKAQKQQIVKNLSAKLPKAGMVIFTSFSREGEKGLSVSQMRQLKSSLRNMGGEYLVAKKNLIKIAAEQTGLAKLAPSDNLGGSVGLALGPVQGDSISLSKALYDFSRTNPALKIFGALLEQRYLDADSFIEFAKLGSKEMLAARLFGMLQHPIKSFLVVLNNIKK